MRRLYSARAASSRSAAVVSPGTLCDGWICNFTPRFASSSATVMIVSHTTATNAMVETGPTLSLCCGSDTDESPAGTQVSMTTSASSNNVRRDGWRGVLDFASAAEPVASLLELGGRASLEALLARLRAMAANSEDYPLAGRLWIIEPGRVRMHLRSEDQDEAD